MNIKFKKSFKNLIVSNKFLNLIIIKPFKFIAEKDAKITLFLVKESYKRLRFSNWALGNSPKWFNHQIDKNYQWEKNGDSSWIERGVFSGLCLQKKSKVLEICCGDGFHAANFYSNKCASIICCDIDKFAIKHAKENNKRKNIKFVVGDIINNMPNGDFDNIIWDIAFAFNEIFNEDQLFKILNNIKVRLTEDGILSGCTLILKKENPVRHLSDSSFKLDSKEDLFNILSKTFKYAYIFELNSVHRHSLYFWCSNKKKNIPFSEEWDSKFSNL